MSNIQERIKGRLEDCQVVLIGDRWKEAYKEDVTEILQHVLNLEPQLMMVSQANAIQGQVINLLASALKEISEFGKSNYLSADKVFEIADEALDHLEKIVSGQS